MIASAPLLLLSLLLASGGLRVETGTPEALCPDLGQVRAAARARLGDIEAEGEWLASYTLVHRPDAAHGGDVVRLQLTDPAGRLRLRRDLVRAGESCTALARALVVVLDAYFRNPAQAEDGLGPAAGAEKAAVVTAAGAAAREPSRVLLDLTGGWSDGWAGGDATSPVVAVGLRLGIAPPSWWLGVQGAWMVAKQSASVASEVATLRRYGLRGYLARDLVRTDRLALFAGAEVMLDLDHADTAMLLGGGRQTRASWGGGARAQLQIGLAQQVFLSVVTALDYAPAAWGGTFVVDGPAGELEIFPASRWRLLLGAGLSVVIF